jgi:hypothetical protein
VLSKIVAALLEISIPVPGLSITLSCLNVREPVGEAMNTAGTLGNRLPFSAKEVASNVGLPAYEAKPAVRPRFRSK